MLMIVTYDKLATQGDTTQDATRQCMTRRDNLRVQGNARKCIARQGEARCACVYIRMEAFNALVYMHPTRKMISYYIHVFGSMNIHA